MPVSKYIDLYELTDLQVRVMKFIGNWAREKKTIIPQKEIIKAMEKEGIKNYTTSNVLSSLMKKGYIRHAVLTSNKTFYVQQKSV